MKQIADPTGSRDIPAIGAEVHRRGSLFQPEPEIEVSIVAEAGLRRRRIATVLAEAGLTVAHQVSTVEELCDAADELEDGVAIVASHIDEPSTVAELRRLRGCGPGLGIVIVSASSHGTGVRRALNAGADGFVLEGRIEETLGLTVRAVHAKQICAPRELRRWVAKPSFTHREKQILALVAMGSTNQEIASKLFLAESTVKSHLASLFGKLGVRSRKDAAALVLDPEEGLQTTALPLDPDTVLSILDSRLTP